MILSLYENCGTFPHIRSQSLERGVYRQFSLQLWCYVTWYVFQYCCVMQGCKQLKDMLKNVSFWYVVRGKSCR